MNAFELVGPDDAPVVVVLGGISAHRHVTASDADPSPGWWEAVVGPGRAVDTRAFRVLGVDFLDGGRAPDGRPARLVTTHDQADALALTLAHRGVDRVHAVIGASYGGMVALALAERYPSLVERLVVVSAAHRSTPMTTAVRALQRGIVELGLETGRTRDALALARALAMTTYRSAREFDERFTLAAERADTDVTFDVERYLRHCGERFADVFAPERFLALSLSADLHRVDPRAIGAPATLVAAEGDVLVPESLMIELAGSLAGGSRLVPLPTRYGHDAFLTEPTKIGAILEAALCGEVTA